jgi:hypothetical protein
MIEPSSLMLSPEEICEITHYKVPKKQLAALQEMGIPAYLRKVNHTVCLLRAHVTRAGARALGAPEGPQLKSARRLQAEGSGTA